MEPNAAIDLKAMSDARDQVRAALASDDPTRALRAAAVELAGGALGRSGVEAVFVAVCDELAEAGREEDSALVAYVLDMIAEW
ncbi:MAG: hypothetical protein K0S65_3597 [Labilithrix sp.]|nr:hypothetical protein [Labilithrix sp.]